MHDSMDIPSSYEWNAIEVKRKHTYEVTYSLKSYHLLKSPYPTNCKNYSKETEFMSHKDCVRRCRRQIMEEKCGFLSHEVDIYKGEPPARFANTTDDELCAKNLNLTKECRRKCPNADCVKHYYKPKIISSREHDHHFVDIDIMIPSEPITSFFHRPQIQIIEFLCYIASILSLWFGFSILSVCFWLKILFFKIKSITFNKLNNILNLQVINQLNIRPTDLKNQRVLFKTNSVKNNLIFHI